MTLSRIKELLELNHNPIHEQDTMANAEARHHAKHNENYNTDGGFDHDIG